MLDINQIYSLVDPIKLIPTEEICTSSARALKEKIIADGKWTSPIIVHESHLFVMDGHHRLEVAKQIDLKLVPVLLSNYDRIGVTAWREGESVTPESIFAMARSGRKFPYKTTRHILRSVLPCCNIPLAELMRSQIDHSSSPPTPDAFSMVAGWA